MTGIPGQTYLNPLNRVKWQNAIRERKSTVLIGNRNFKLTYYRELESGNYVDKVSFKPITGMMVPCGTFDVKTVLDELWLSGEN